MIETLKEKRNLKKLAIKLQKVMKKKINCIKKLGGAAALMYEPPLGLLVSLTRCSTEAWLRVAGPDPVA